MHMHQKYMPLVHVVKAQLNNATHNFDWLPQNNDIFSYLIVIWTSLEPCNLQAIANPLWQVHMEVAAPSRSSQLFTNSKLIVKISCGIKA